MFDWIEGPTKNDLLYVIKATKLPVAAVCCVSGKYKAFYLESVDTKAYKNSTLDETPVVVRWVNLVTCITLDDAMSTVEKMFWIVTGD